jgi:competence protein ComEC
MRRPAFYIAITLLGGNVASRLLAVEPWQALAVAGLLAGAAVFSYWRKRGKDLLSASSPVAIPVLAAVFFLGVFQQGREMRRETLARDQVRALEQMGPRRFQGTVAGEPVLREDDEGGRVVLVLRDVVWLDDQAKDADAAPLEKPIACRVQATLTRAAAEEIGAPHQGRRIEFVGVLREPPTAKHRTLFDYQAYLRALGVGAMATLWSADAVRRVPEGDRAWEIAVFSRLMQWRRTTIHGLREALSRDRAAIAEAMLLGETTNLGDAARRTFNRAGVSHLFSVSGLHTAMIAGMVFLLCRALFVPPRASTWALFGFLAVYCVLVGFRAPVVRGAVMAACMAMPILLRRRVDALGAFSIALFLTMLAAPRSMLRSDFQLSYACTFGLITLYPALRELLEVSRDKGAPWAKRLVSLYNRHIAQGLAIFLAAQLALLPLLIFYFDSVSLIGFVANLILVPLATLILALTWVFSLLGGLLPVLGHLLGPALEGLIGFFEWVARGLAAFPGAVARVPRLPWWLALLYYGLVFSGPHLLMENAPGGRERRGARMLLRLAGVLVLLVWWPIAARLPWTGAEPPASLQITMLDVGQGDSLVLQTPNGLTLVVDTGQASGGRTLRDYLRAGGVDEIHGLILTHPDADHIGGAADIVREFYVGNLFVGPNVAGTETQKNLDAAVAAAFVPTRQLRRGDTLRFLGQSADLRLEVLHPPDEGLPGVDLNDHSVVLVARYGEIDFLLTGDAGLKAEADMLRAFGPEILDIEVLKLGHHGSRTSSGADFIEAATPQIALVSVGARNRFGHPSPEVIERLEQAGAQILNTTVHGSVDLRTDGKRIWIRATRTGE